MYNFIRAVELCSLENQLENSIEIQVA